MAVWSPDNVTGGAHVQDGIVSWIPGCSAIQYASISASRAARFDLTTAEYIVDASGLRLGGVQAEGHGLEGHGPRRRRSASHWLPAGRVPARPAAPQALLCCHTCAARRSSYPQ